MKKIYKVITSNSYRLFVLVITILTGWKVYWMYPTLPVGRANSLLFAIAGYAFNGVALLFTVMGILFAITGSKLVQNMKKSGHFQNLVHSLFITAISFLLCFLFSHASGYVADSCEQRSLAIASGGIVGAILILIHSGHKFYQVLMHLDHQ